MMQTPSLISVNERAWGEIGPRAGIVHFMLIDVKWFWGRAALEKAVELKRLVVAFRERAIPDTALTLEGASLDVSTGLFSKASSVMYRVRVTVPTDQVAEVLDVLASAKRSEEHTSELQSLAYLVCRLLLEKKKKNQTIKIYQIFTVI